jgi:putative tricarboxylic transport membrane protein
MGFENIALGFHIAITPFNLLVAVVGITLGTIIGVLPGLGGANGVAILLPLTFRMPPTSAIILLTSLYWGALFGGAITSVLFNIPGEPWSVATTFDGYPLARQGKGAQALTAAFTSSFIGALFATLLITFFAPLLADVALHFGPPEFFAIQALTFSSFVGLGGGDPVKSFISIVVGLILAAVGLDIVTGQLRMTFGLTPLMSGFDFIVAVIGLFGIGEILVSVEEGLKFDGARTKMNLKVVFDTWKTMGRYWRTFLRSCIIGFWMGFKPGGATPASFMAYAFAKRASKHPERFGKGEIEGVVAPETAAHAAGVAAMLPMITLGIPGSPTAAVMFGGLIIWGLQPGPMLFKEQPDFVWGLIASMYTGNIIGVLMVLAFVPFFAAILRLPFAILTPFIVVICAIGAYAVHNNMIDIWYMIIFGVVGYVFKKLDYPLAPLVLALVLGDFAENALRQSLIMSQGTLLIFFRRPIAAAITVLAIFFLALPAITMWRRRREQRRAAAGPAPGAGPPIAAIREPPAPTEIR